MRPEPATYIAEVDGELRDVKEFSLAEVANILRGAGSRIRIWSPLYILLIDTKYGDIYGLVTTTEKTT